MGNDGHELLSAPAAKDLIAKCTAQLDSMFGEGRGSPATDLLADAAVVDWSQDPWVRRVRDLE